MDANTDFYASAAAHRKQNARRKGAAKWLLLGLLLLCLCDLVLMTAFPTVSLFFTISPFNFFLMLSAGWFNAMPLFYGLVLVPLAGWLLLHKALQAGRWLILGSHILLLILNVILTMIHLFTGITHLFVLGSGSTLPLQHTFISCTVNLIYCIAVLVLTHRWYPKKKS